MPSRSDTPTPGDLSARLPGYLVKALSAMEKHHARAVIEYIAALSALPAAGEPVGEVIEGFTDAMGGAAHVVRWYGREPKLGTKLYITPQPSAAEDAAAGAQGDVAEVLAFLDSEIDATGAQSYNPTVAGFMRTQSLIRRLAAPAAGKGVDDVLDLATQYGDHSVDSRNRESWDFDAHGLKQLAAALTRQPVAGDGWRSVVYAALRSIRYNANNGSQDRPPHERLRLIGVEADRAIGCMEASYAAPAATPTDGGEGNNAR